MMPFWVAGGDAVTCGRAGCSVREPLVNELALGYVE